MIVDEQTIRSMIWARVRELAIGALRFVVGVFVVSKLLHWAGLL